MRADTLRLARDGQDNHQPGRTTVKGIHRDHQRWSSPGLFMSLGRVEINHPHLPPGWIRRAHSSSTPSANVASHAARSSCSSCHALGLLRRAAKSALNPSRKHLRWYSAMAFSSTACMDAPVCAASSCSVRWAVSLILTVKLAIGQTPLLYTN